MASTSASNQSAVGDYTIELTSGTDSNYMITTNNGILTVVPDAKGNVVLVKEKDGFSPNGDGINDAWVIHDIEKYPNSVVRIFNRSGQIVFEMKGYNNSFEGISNRGGAGVKLPVGSYIYTVEFNSPGVPPVKGWMFINY